MPALSAAALGVIGAEHTVLILQSEAKAELAHRVRPANGMAFVALVWSMTCLHREVHVSASLPWQWGTWWLIQTTNDPSRQSIGVISNLKITFN